MDWIRVDAGLPTHPKALDLAELLNEPLAWAYVVRLWGWAVANAQSGAIKGINPKRSIEAAAGWSGKPGRLADALLRVGFVDSDDSGALLLHDWNEHNGKAVERARKDAERLKEYRETKRLEKLQGSGRTSTVRVRNDDGTTSVARNGRTDGRTDGRKAREEEESAREKPATAATASPASVLTTAPPPAVVADSRLMQAVGSGAFDEPWSGAGHTDPPPGPKWAVLLWLWCSYRRHLRCGDCDLPDTRGDEPSPEQLADTVTRCGTLDRFRQAWVCWLGEDYARERSPPFAWAAFASKKQLPQMLARAASVAWQGADTGDWELPETGGAEA